MIHHSERSPRQCSRSWSDKLQLPCVCVQPLTSSYNFQLPHGRHDHHGCHGHGGHCGHVGHGGRGGRGEHGGHGGQHGPGLDRTKLTYNIDFPGKL